MAFVTKKDSGVKTVVKDASRKRAQQMEGLNKLVLRPNEYYRAGFFESACGRHAQFFRIRSMPLSHGHVLNFNNNHTMSAMLAFCKDGFRTSLGVKVSVPWVACDAFCNLPADFATHPIPGRAS